LNPSLVSRTKYGFHTKPRRNYCVYLFQLSEYTQSSASTKLLLKVKMQQNPQILTSKNFLGRGAYWRPLFPQTSPYNRLTIKTRGFAFEFNAVCFTSLLYLSFLPPTSISAYADGPLDTASRKINHMTLHAKCNHLQATSVVSDI